MVSFTRFHQGLGKYLIPAMGGRPSPELLATSVLDLLYPPHCAICEKSLERHEFVCANCIAQIERVPPPFCRCGCALSENADVCSDCATRLWYFDQARAYGYYDEENALGRLIKALKYGGERALVRPLTDLLVEMSSEFQDQPQAITFIPMTRNKKRERGFNQAEQLARELAQRLNLPLVKALEKIRETRPQASLSGVDRLTNLETAFRLASPPQCSNIILVDDVVTTGTTIETASRVLREGGYEKIFVLALARVRTVSDRVIERVS
jgi:ComF family protein